MATNTQDIVTPEADYTSLPPGTVIVQRIQHWAQYVGVICDNEVTHLLPRTEMLTYHSDPGQYYITLALNHFSETRPYRGTENLFRVPRYTLGPKSKTVFVILSDELPLQQELCADGYNTKKSVLTLSEAVFHHTESQCITLELIWILHQYMSGITFLELPESFKIYTKAAERYYAALQMAIPR